MVARPQPDGASIGTLPVASRNSLHQVVRRTAFDVQGVQIAGGIVGRLFDVSAPFQASIRTAPARKIDSAAVAHDQSGRRTSRDVHDSVAWAVRVDSAFSEELDVSPDRLGQSASERLPVRLPGSQLTGAP